MLTADCESHSNTAGGGTIVAVIYKTSRQSTYIVSLVVGLISESSDIQECGISIESEVKVSATL